MEQERKIDVMIAEACHEEYVDIILDTIEAAAKVRGTGIAKRTHEYVAQKMKEGKAVIALEGNKFAGFSYIESWGNKQYVTTSGLIVHPDFRGLGIAKRIKEMTFQLARMRWPHAKIFSLTSGAAVMKMNTELGYLCRPDGRRGFLERLRRLCQPRYPRTYRPPLLHLYRNALRSGRSSSGRERGEGN